MGTACRCRWVACCDLKPLAAASVRVAKQERSTVRFLGRPHAETYAILPRSVRVNVNETH